MVGTCLGPRFPLKAAKEGKGFRMRHPKICQLDYCELKALEKQQIQEILSALPFYLKAGQKISTEKGALLHQERNILISRAWELTLKWNCANKPTNITLIFHSFSPYNFHSQSHNLQPLAQAPLSCQIPQFIVLCVERHVSFGS